MLGAEPEMTTRPIARYTDTFTHGVALVSCEPLLNAVFPQVRGMPNL